MRTASLEPWRARRIDGWSAKNFGFARRAMLFVGADSVDIALKDDRFVSMTNFTRDGAPVAKIGKGAAAAITDDGYFVTAAHCLPTDSDEPFLLVIESGALPQAFRGRVVHSCWDREHGFPGRDFADFAIIHAEGAAPACFTWAAAESLEPGSPVLAIGISKGNESAAGGEFIRCVTSDEGRRRAPELEKFAFNAPTTSGDSGGPVMLADGTLVGVTCEVHLALDPHDWRSEGVRADPSWVAAIIARDRASRADGAR